MRERRRYFQKLSLHAKESDYIIFYYVKRRAYWNELKYIKSLLKARTCTHSFRCNKKANLY